MQPSIMDQNTPNAAEILEVSYLASLTIPL